RHEAHTWPSLAYCDDTGQSGNSCNMGKAALPILYILSLVFASGCTKQDTDCLTRIGRKVVDRTHGVTDAVREKIDLAGLRGNGTNNAGGVNASANGSAGAGHDASAATSAAAGAANGEEGASAGGEPSLQQKIAGRLRWDK